MHTQSNSFSGPVSARRLDAYRVTLELITLCRPLCARMGRGNRRMGAQLKESLASILQNLAEGMRRTGKDRAHLLTVSLGSCEEVRALLDSGRAFGFVSVEEHLEAEQLADRICAMTFRLRQRSL